VKQGGSKVKAKSFAAQRRGRRDHQISRSAQQQSQPLQRLDFQRDIPVRASSTMKPLAIPGWAFRCAHLTVGLKITLLKERGV
jgi:hypothetical protein